MHGSEARHSVTDPVDTTQSQMGRTEETVWGETPLVVGLAATKIDDESVKIAVTIHHGLYTSDYKINEFTLSDGENIRELIKENIIRIIVAYSTSKRGKSVGAGVTLILEEICPGICAHIWRKLDIVGVFHKSLTTPSGTRTLGNTLIDVGKILPSTIQRRLTFSRRTITSSKEWRIRKQYLVGQAIRDNCMRKNAERYWLSPGGPLAPGKADVVIIDDPLMPALIPLIKEARPEVKIIYRSHIEVRQDLVAVPGTPQEQITQIARFDPSKGIPDVIESYRKLCAPLRTDAPKRLPPQLSICGHDAIDDPDAEIVYNQTTALLRQRRYVPIAKEVIVARIGPSDQMLNVMITTAKIVVQLSLREGFELKVSEELHHRKPVLATGAGGIPLQVEDGKSGFLVEVGDTDTVTNRLFDLYTNDDLHATMSNHAKTSVSDEVGTVSNAACRLYLAAKLAGGEGLEPSTGCIMDMAKAEAGKRFETGEPTLPRSGIDFKGKAKCIELYSQIGRSEMPIVRKYCT
ncbi:hypothetical protein HOY80DRAFT_1056958 [Tuber brumale]|nr:hypothetical protein HOY80DRAFT_1056958 [Tuber brumale]